MEVKQCDFCRRPHQMLSNKLCTVCVVKLDEDFIKIRDYIYDHEGAGAEEVSVATGVPKKSILYLLKEERLSIGGEVEGALLLCESCKKPVRSGRLCASCKNEVMSSMQQATGAVVKPKQVKKEEEERSIKGSAKLQT